MFVNLELNLKNGNYKPQNDISSIKMIIQPNLFVKKQNFEF